MLIGLLINLIIFAVMAGVIWWILSLLPLPHPFPTVIRVVFALVCLLFVLQELLPLVGHRFLLN